MLGSKQNAQQILESQKLSKKKKKKKPKTKMYCKVKVMRKKTDFFFLKKRKNFSIPKKSSK